MSILFITHDLGVIAEMCDQVAVMYLGKIVEAGPVDEIFYSPAHPYTRGLLKSIPKIGARAKDKLESIEGTVPVPMGLPERCGFYDRCSEAIAGLCDRHAVPEAEIGTGHRVRCFLHEEVVKTHQEALGSG
jgi:peptide/nickel transport system ATP-binding protein